jgi:hypothetical protein
MSCGGPWQENTPLSGAWPRRIHTGQVRQAFGKSVAFLLAVVFSPWHMHSMANLVITYWRDIPSAVSVKLGRKEEKRMLDNRFMEAIDMAAMRAGATNSDDYLNDWRRGEPAPVSDDLALEADTAKADLEARYTQDVIKQLIGNGGRNPS